MSVVIDWKSMNDPALREAMKARRAIVFRFGNHLATVYAAADDVWHSTYDNRPIDIPGAAKPTAWAELRDFVD